ncbi:alpha/beta hydrolase [Actinomycetes bacterium KLBMP 9797]
MRTVIVAVTAAAVVASPVAVPAAAARPATVGPETIGIAWNACADPALRNAGVECGFVSVPLDHAKPTGTRIRLAVSLKRHTVPRAKYQGVMLVNPGGPGASGLGLALLGQDVPGKAGGAYDWIGFDPRGVGASRPALRCVPNYFAGPRPDYVARTKTLEKAWLNRSEAYADACAKNGGALLRHIRTVDHAKDVDHIRAALGRPTINFYGYSWGTYLGQVYATLFPSRVRRMVLDSNVHPDQVWYEANLDQNWAFDRNFKIWTGWVAKHDKVYRLGKSAAAVRKVYYAEQAKLRAKPVGVVGPAEWSDAFVPVGYSQAYWPLVATAFANRVTKGDITLIRQLFEAFNGVGDDNGFANYLATGCTDARFPAKWDTWRRDASRIHAKAPFLAWNNTWFNAPCHFWRAPAGKPVTVDGRRVATVLLIGETLDAPTPFEGSLRVRKLFPRARLLAVPGGPNHGASLFGNACVDNVVAAYLATGTLPSRKSGSRADATCAPRPEPTPEVARHAPRPTPPHRFS